MKPARFDDLLRSCIHCGLCLNDCPTYRLTGDEAESPRGRLVLMRRMLHPEPGQDWQPDRGPIDRCMGCRGCETVCPSGVRYGELLEQARFRLPVPDDKHRRLVRMFLRGIVPHRRRLAVASMGAYLLARTRLTSRSLGRLLSTIPRRRPHWPRLVGPREGEVAILAGCAQPVFTPGVLRSTVALVRAAGHRPFVPRGQGCCGALAAHSGDLSLAREAARRTIRSFEGAREVVVPSAGCSAHLRRLDHLFESEPDWQDRARSLAARTSDLVVWLGAHREALGFRPDPRRVVFQRPCHLRHAQGVDGTAEELLSGIGGVEVLPAPRADLCCGSAGAWSMEYPEMAARRREEKLDDLTRARPDLVLTANPGCELFLDASDRDVEVRHLAEYLASLLVRD